MANIMSQKDVKNKVHRNGFDLSFRNSFTSKVGELLPIFCKEVIPGDKWSIDLSSFTRTAPVQTAAFTRIKEYIDFYFVPNHLLWDKFPNFIVQTNNYNHARGINLPPDNFSSHPFFTSEGLGEYFEGMKNAHNAGSMKAIPSTLKLLNYLGYGDLSALSDGFVGFNYSFNIFPLAAYQKIYYDYFAYSQWETNKPYCYNFDYVMTNPATEIAVGSIRPISPINLQDDIFTLRYANYKKDLFMGVLPNKQFGDEASVSPFVNPVSLTYKLSSNDGILPTSGSSASFSTGGTLRQTSPSSNSFPKIQLSSNGKSGNISVFALRFMEVSQKWKEITQSGSLDYASQIYKHWNVSVSDEKSYRSRWIGGTDGNIAISEVVNNNLASETDQALIAGKGVGSFGKNNVVNFESKGDYGWIIGIYHAVPTLDYLNLGVSRQMTKTTAADYAIPEFDNLGMVPVPLMEMNFDLNSDSDDNITPLGYAPRYYDYKTSVDIINGAFSTSLRDWVAPVNTDTFRNSIINDGANSYFNFKVHPSTLDSIFVAQAAVDDTVKSDQLYSVVFFDTKVVRNLSVDGLPY